jgi:hypothetical protein
VLEPYDAKVSCTVLRGRKLPGSLILCAVHQTMGTSTGSVAEQWVNLSCAAIFRNEENKAMLPSLQSLMVTIKLLKTPF